MSVDKFVQNLLLNDRIYFLSFLGTVRVLLKRKKHTEDTEHWVLFCIIFSDRVAKCSNYINLDTNYSLLVLDFSAQLYMWILINMWSCYFPKITWLRGREGAE